MISYLKISNLALMHEVELEFERGFNVITGETGAGKSVLLGALSILAGNRVPKTIVRAGTQQCDIEAIINLVPATLSRVNAFLELNGLPTCEDNQLVLKRSVNVSKAGRIFINGGLATLAQLNALGNEWIDFHGPGEPQKLFHENYQLQLLDLFGGNAKMLATYRERYQIWRDALAEIETIRTQEKFSEDELTFAQTQLDAFNALDLSDEAIAELESQYAQLSHAQELEQLLSGIENALGDDGLAGTLSQGIRLANEISEILPAAGTLAERVNSLAIEIEDLRSEYARLQNNSQFDEETIAEINERMNAWLELRRKYGPAPEQVRAKRDALAERIERQSDIEGALERAIANAEKIENELRELAGTLHQTRAKAAKKLMGTAMENLKELGFKKAVLALDLNVAGTLTETGYTRCNFLFSANVGQEPLPLNQIASAGETARVMLALKAALAEVDATPVLVFDEVDANVGGEIAVHVARKLAAIAGTHQVFCITHLAQVAALGDHHFCVEKTQDKTSTTIDIFSLGNGATAAREDELARMLGDRNSKAAHEHAKELLNH